MSVKKLAYFIVLSVALSCANPVLAAKTVSSGRYFIKSKGVILKSGLSVRHTFEGGFTADLSEWQFRVAKLFGFDIEPVQKLSILPLGSDVNELEDVDAVLKKGNKQEHHILPTEQVSWGVRAITEMPAGGGGVSIAVLDSGIDVDHPDLTRRVSSCKDFTAAKESVVEKSCDDRNGHGTHVSGIAAADGGKDGLGIFGVAPESSLIVFKVCDAGGVCFADDVAAALRMAVDDGAQIVVMSIGADAPNSLIEEAIKYAEEKYVLIVAAAGNDGPYAGSIDYPAAYPYVVSVGAVNNDLLVPEWSSRGINTHTEPRVIEEKDLEFAAPGVNIESTWRNGKYAILSGTSMAAPHVAGLAARLWNADTENPVQAVREKLYEFTVDIAQPGEDEDSGYGIPVLK